MLNVTPLLSINSSIQTSWGPGLWPCTPPVSLPEAGEACLLAHPPHLATGLSHMHKHTHTRSKSKAHAKISYTYIHTHKDAHIHIQAWVHACTLWHAGLQKVSVHTYLAKTNSLTHTHTYVDIHAHACHPARPSCHWKIVLHSTEGVMGCYQQDHSMDGCPNWE